MVKNDINIVDQTWQNDGVEPWKPRFFIGKTIHSSNSHFLNQVDKVIEKVTNNQWKKQSTFNQQTYVKSRCRKVSEKDAKRIENECPKWSQNRSNVIKIEVLKMFEKLWIRRKKTPWPSRIQGVVKPQET